MEQNKEIFSLENLASQPTKKKQRYNPPTDLVVHNDVDMVDCEKKYRLLTYDIEGKTRKPEEGSNKSDGEDNILNQSKQEEINARLSLVTLPPPQLQLVTMSSNIMESMYKSSDEWTKSLQRWKSYYPFGISTSFEIDVMNCTLAPKHMVYRGLVKEHVAKLVREFCSKPKSCVVVADLMPYDPKTELPLQTVYRSGINSLKFWVISGQHSIEAAKTLQMSSFENLEPIKKLYKFRSSRILVNCPWRESLEISKEANILHTKFMHKAPYLTQLKHGRSQWVAFGRPNAPKAGSHKGDSFRKSWEHFVELMSHTLAKGFHKYDIPMVTCDDDIFDKWIDIIQKYIVGYLPNNRGEVNPHAEDDDRGKSHDGQIKQAPNTAQVNTTLFRCISGLESKEVRQLQSQILDGQVWMKRGKDVDYHIDMEDACKKFKGDRCLKDAILKYLEKSNAEVDWDAFCKMYGIGDSEYKHIYTLSTEYIKVATNRSKYTPRMLPESVTSFLSYLYRKARGFEAHPNQLPWTICVVGEQLESMVDAFQTISNHIPVGVVFLETQNNLQWTMEQFNLFLLGLDTINIGTSYVLISFISFELIGTLIGALKVRKGTFHFEVGVYQSKQDVQRFTTGSFGTAVVVALISKDTNLDGFEYLMKSINKPHISRKASNQDKSDDIQRHQGFSINKTKPDARDSLFIKRLVKEFCGKSLYAIDVFTGGVALREGLMLQRRCLAMVFNEVEKIAIENQCVSMIESDQMLADWAGIEKHIVPNMQI